MIKQLTAIGGMQGQPQPQPPPPNPRLLTSSIGSNNAMTITNRIFLKIF